MVGFCRSAIACARQLGVYNSGLNSRAVEEVEEVFVKRASRKTQRKREMPENPEEKFKVSFSDFSADKLFSKAAEKVHGITPKVSPDESEEGYEENVDRNEEYRYPYDILTFGKPNPAKDSYKPPERWSFPLKPPEDDTSGSTTDSTMVNDGGGLGPGWFSVSNVRPKRGLGPVVDDAQISIDDARRAAKSGEGSNWARDPKPLDGNPKPDEPVSDDSTKGASRRERRESVYGSKSMYFIGNPPKRDEDRPVFDSSAPVAPGWLGRPGPELPPEPTVTPKEDFTGYKEVKKPIDRRIVRTKKRVEFWELPPEEAEVPSEGSKGMVDDRELRYRTQKAREVARASKNSSSNVSRLSNSTERSVDRLVTDSLANVDDDPPPSKSTRVRFSLVVRNILLSLGNVEKGDRMAALQPWTGMVREQDVIEVLQNLHDSRLASSFFDWAEKQYNFQHNVFTYNTYLRTLVTTGWPEKVWEEFQRMIKNEVFPDKYTYGIVIRGLCIAKRMDLAMKVAQDMEMKRIPSSLVANFLIAGLCQAGMVNEAFTYFSNMDDRCLADVVSYNLLIHGLCKVNQVNRAVGLFATMLGRHVQPTMTTYNVVLYGLCKARRMKEAVGLLEEMSEGLRGLEIVPDVVTYNTVIDGLCKANDLYRARFVLKMMMKHNVLPTVVTYNTLIDGLCKAGQLEEADEIFQKMQQKMVQPTVVTYTSLVHGNCKKKLLDKANEYFEDMKEREVHPNVFTYTALIRGHCVLNMVKETMALLDEMYRKNVWPNLITYTTIVCLLCKNGDVDGACGVFNEMLKRKHVQPDRYAFITIILNLCSQKCYQKGYVYFKKMVGIYQLAPDPMVCKMLADGLEAACERDKLDDVRRVAESNGIRLGQVKSQWENELNSHVEDDVLEGIQ